MLYVDDKESVDGNILLTLHKNIFYLILFLTFYSHLQIAVSDPGSIDFYNNLDILEFYCFIYRDIKLSFENYKINKKFRLNKEDNESNNEEDSSHSEKDDQIYDSKKSINKKLKRKIEHKLHIKTNKCMNCYVIRPKDSHHCNECHCCILERDHHCPWINNCVGLFNKKYFILFNMYAFISVIYSCFIYYYYSAYKNNKTFRNDIAQNIIAIFWGLFAFIYGLFVAIMVIEQRDNILKEFKAYNKDKQTKSKLMGIKMRIIFGGNFTFKWFFPFYEGGKKQLFYFIRQKRYEIYQKIKKEKEENDGGLKNNNEILEKRKEVKAKNE